MSSPLESLLLGRTLVGRYRVEEVIGRGGMSVVYRAIDERLERPVALKIVSFPAEVGDREREMLRERLRREAASAAKLSPHPNVVQIFDYGTDPELDLDFIAMELLPGSDLKEVLRTGRPPLDHGLWILSSAARGIAAGHRAGIVHRDVKPANIFLVRHDGETRPEVVKVLDFGIAKALDPGADDDLTRHDHLPHSPGYASPEQIQPGRALTAASDVYQLGLVAYEVLAGERPFEEADRQRLARGESVSLPERGGWADLPPTLKRAVEKALAVDPDDRWPDAGQFGAALSAGEEDGTVLLADPSADRPPADDRTVWMGPKPPIAVRRRPPGRSRLVPLALGAAAVALVLWLLVRPGSGVPGDAAAPAEVAAEEVAEPDPRPRATPEQVELDDDFRPLILEAFRNLRESVSAEEGEEAATAVQEVIYDLQEAWAEGDIERHLGHYADRVEFGGSEVSIDRIRSVREESIGRYEDREITIPRLAIEFVEPGRARALVDRTWAFSGADEEWEGAARDELILQKTGDEWLVIAERELENF